jgi:dTDP-4-dehydrorhamnose reductase
MNVVILGNGYIAGHLGRELTQRHHVTTCSRSQIDYGNHRRLLDFIVSNKTDVVICAFGFTGNPNIDEAEEKKSLCWRLNVVDPLLVNSVCSDLGVAFCCISSGCIYDGYERVWESTDEPNFGMLHNSSFYSKSKHAFEMSTSHLPGTVIRIRMPFSGCRSQRNYLMKLLRYPLLIDVINSKTCVGDLCRVVGANLEHMLDGATGLRRTLQVVNPNPLTTRAVVDLMRKHGLRRDDWKFIPIEELPAKAPRSNCVVKTELGCVTKEIDDESISIDRALKSMSLDCK